MDKLSTVRIGSARYSVPHALVGRHLDVTTVDDRIEVWHDGQLVASHRLVPPGGVSIMDEHYDRSARKPQRAVRACATAEKAFLALGEEAEAFLRAAAAAGTQRLATHIVGIATLEAATRWSRRWPGPPSSAGSPPTTCAQSSPPGPRHPPPDRPARHSAVRCRRCPPGQWTPTAPRRCGRARSRGCVLLVVSKQMWAGTDLTVAATGRRWVGLG